MGEGECNEPCSIPQPSRATLTANALANGSADLGFKLLLDSLANISQQECDWLNGVVIRMQQEIRRERAAFAKVLDKLNIGDDHSGMYSPYYDRVIDHIGWLQNEAQGYARLQDLAVVQFDLLRRAAGKGAEEISTGNWEALTDYVKSLVPNEDK
jgi:hypothetical protein